MQNGTLLMRSLAYYRRTHAVVVLGVAVAVAVLAGALLVGDSVRASLRLLFLQRLGNTDHVISSSGFFREQLADVLQSQPRFGEHFTSAAPLIVMRGFVTHQTNRRRASGVQVYGVDGRFWRFHGTPNQPLGEREVFASPGLAGELDAHPGDPLLVRIEKPSDIPAESLYGRKNQGQTLRLLLREVLADSRLGEFSIYPQQAAVRALFVPLKRLQQDLQQENQVNTLLLARAHRDDAEDLTGVLAGLLGNSFDLTDIGLRVRVLERQQCLSLESRSALLAEPLVEAVENLAASRNSQAVGVFSYVANTIRAADREIPYSVVTATEFETLGESVDSQNHAGEQAGEASEPILLNEWTARELGTRPGAKIQLEYYLWSRQGRLETRTTEFQVAGILPLQGAAVDPDFTPDYPGITDTESLSDWDPPFPIDLSRIRPRDEEYWDRYRSAPKCFIRLKKGRELWGSRWGSLTSLRIYPAQNAARPQLQEMAANFSQELRASLDPLQLGFSLYPARSRGLEASRGATDFGEYFLYFSFFLVASALLLTGLFFKFGVEQRVREIGTLRALGFSPAKVGRLFLAEGLVLAFAGSALGAFFAWMYAEVILLGLRTWWMGAVGTDLLSVHVSARPLLLGGTGGILAALICIAWSLRRLIPSSPRSLLAAAPSQPADSTETPQTRSRIHYRVRLALALMLAAGVILILASMELLGQAAGFFGSGILLLGASLSLSSFWLRRPSSKILRGSGWSVVARLGFRNARCRPTRSVLCIALIASASFVLVSVDAFRQEEENFSLDRKSGSGGFPLLAESIVPLHHDPNTAAGREALNLVPPAVPAHLQDVRFVPFRLRPGEDASCLNLYRPGSPRILAPPAAFLKSNRFSFRASLSETDEERENPWLLLEKETPDGAVPVIADATSLTYVLHRAVGEDLFLQSAGKSALRLRVVASLSDSIFQGELLMSEGNFLRLFPGLEGYRFLLVEAAPDQASGLAALLEEQLSDFGFDVMATQQRLARYHRVENTYLSTFQTLGGLGLILGTLGLGAVLLRNVLERRRELALLRAVGYNRSHFALMVMAENILLLAAGLGAGAAGALVAIAPVLISRGGQLPAFSLALLALVLATGLAASVAATRAAIRLPLLSSLRAE